MRKKARQDDTSQILNPRSEKRKNDVYKINCSDCENSYIGQLGKSCSDFHHDIVSERTKEHLRDYKKAKKKRKIVLEELQKQYDELNNAKIRFKMNDLNNSKKEHDEENLNQRFKTACVDH